MLTLANLASRFARALLLGELIISPVHAEGVRGVLSRQAGPCRRGECGRRGLRSRRPALGAAHEPPSRGQSHFCRAEHARCGQHWRRELYRLAVAPKDGTVFGSVSRNLPSQAVIGREALKVDPREFRWIGSSGTNTVVCYVGAASAIRKAEDLFTRDLIVGGIGSGSTQSMVPTALRRLLDMRFKVVEGYKGNADALVALERGEIDGLCSGFSPLRTTHASLLKDGRVRLLLHSGTIPLPEAPNIPSFYGFANSE